MRSITFDKCILLLIYNNLQYSLLPLYRRRRLAGDVVNNPGHAFHLVHDTLGDFLQELVRQAGPAGGHEIDGFHGAQGYHVVIASGIALDAYGLDRQEHGECLAGLVVQVMPDE